MDRPDLAELTERTLSHYAERAERFWEGTRDHDVSQNIEAMLKAIDGEPPFEILDFGCGPGRDLADLKKRGHNPTGLDGTERFAEMARAHAGVPVLHQDFLNLDLPAKKFHAIFANASLFHIPSAEQTRVLTQLRKALRYRGVVFCSNPRGDGKEGYYGDSRYGVFQDLDAWRDVFASSGFVEVRHYYRPTGKPREEQPWLAMVWRAAID